MRTSSTNGANVHTSDSWIAKQVGSSGGDARHAYEALQGKPNVEVVVQYCGEWGYAPRFEDLAGKIKKKFVRNLDRLVIIGKKDQDATSNFEVFVNNMLVHSKKTQNDGFVDTTLKEEKLFNCINKALKGDLLEDESSYGTMMNLEAKPAADDKNTNEQDERKSLIFSIVTYVIASHRH